jgi:hypothetical protein
MNFSTSYDNFDRNSYNYSVHNFLVILDPSVEHFISINSLMNYLIVISLYIRT